MRGLWKGLAVPTVMYGLEIMEVGGKEKRGLEIAGYKIEQLEEG